MIIQDFTIECEADCANSFRCICSNGNRYSLRDSLYPLFSVRNKNNFHKSGEWGPNDYELNCRSYMRKDNNA